MLLCTRFLSSMKLPLQAPFRPASAHFQLGSFLAALAPALGIANSGQAVDLRTL